MVGYSSSYQESFKCNFLGLQVDVSLSDDVINSQHHVIMDVVAPQNVCCKEWNLLKLWLAINDKKLFKFVILNCFIAKVIWRKGKWIIFWTGNSSQLFKILYRVTSTISDNLLFYLDCHTEIWCVQFDCYQAQNADTAWGYFLGQFIFKVRLKVFANIFLLGLKNFILFFEIAAVVKLKFSWICEIQLIKCYEKSTCDRLL